MPPLKRSYRPSVDLPALLSLLGRRARAGLAEEMAEDALRALGVRPGSEPERDAVVALGREEKLLGWADVYLPPGSLEADLLLAVDPDGGDEVRVALMGAAIDRARAAGAASILVYARPADVATLSFLDGLGAQPVAGYCRLSTELARLRAAPPLPAGARIEACAGPSGAAVALAAVRAAWSDLPGHKPATPASVAIALEAFGPDGHLALVGAAGRAVGVVRCLLVGPGEGYVDAPGLAPHLRSRGAYAALLGVAASRLAQLGARTATLESWGDPPEAREAWAMLGWEVEAVEEGRRLRIEAGRNFRPAGT